MKPPVRFVAALAAAVSAFASVARAHPGHDGDHEFTWDFRHLAAHPGATFLWASMAAVCLYGSYRLARSASQPRKRS